MQTKSVTKHPEYQANPFSLNADKAFIVSATRQTREVIDRETGLIIETHHEMYQVDTRPFVKLFYNNDDYLLRLSGYGFRILHQVIRELKPSEDQVYLNSMSLKIKYGVGNVRDIRQGISELLECNILARKNEMHMYYINPDKLFIGNRMKHYSRIS